MREYFTIPVIANISEFDVFSQIFNVVEALLTDEDSAPFQTNFAESLFVICF